MQRSIDFYGLLGFEVTETHTHRGRLDWAALAGGEGRLMLARAGGAIDPGRQGVLFYLYVEDLDTLRDHLVASGLTPGAIVDGSPGPEREMALCDPDGYRLMVAEI